MNPSPLPSDAFELGPVLVAPSLNRIVRDGQTVDLEPRVMRVLAVLAEEPGEVKTREALHAAVWPDTVVNDEALTRAISDLRKALGEEVRTAVETIRGRGYRLTLPVSRIAVERDAGQTRALSVPLGADIARADPAAPEHPPEPTRASERRTAPLALAALVLAGFALVIALWAIQSRPTPSEVTPMQVTAPPYETLAEPGDSVRIDSTSEYYVEGLSEWGIYRDTSADRYFQFVPDSE